MINELKNLLSSDNEDHLTQAIELILSLDMGEELYQGFKEYIDDSDLNKVQVGSKFSNILNYRTRKLRNLLAFCIERTCFQLHFDGNNLMFFSRLRHRLG